MLPTLSLRAVRPRFWIIPLLALLVLFPVRPAAADPAEKPAAAILPASTAAYVEVSRPKDLADLVSDHPLAKQLEQSPDIAKALQSEQFKKLRGVLDLVGKRSSGVVVAVDPATQGLVILTKSQDPKANDSVRDALFTIARDDAKAKGNPDPVEPSDYRGLTAWKVGDGYVGHLGPWLLVSNSGLTAKAVADLYLDGGTSLADDKEFAKARDLAVEGRHEDDKTPAAFGYVRLALLRQLGFAKELIDNHDKSDNPAIELLLGGIMADLRDSPFVTATLDSGKQGIRLSLTTPHDPAKVPAERKYYFSPTGGGADAPLLPAGTIASVSSYRDLAAFWQAAPDLFNEGVAGQIAQSESGLSTFLGGKSFSADILGALRPEIQIVAATQDFKAQGVAEPSIRLPAFATVFRIKPGEAKTVRKTFKLAFQSLIAFANLDAASKNRPALETNNETRGKAEVLYATYDADYDKPAEKPADKAGEKAGDKPAAKAKDDTYLNFSPAIVLSDDYLILASTRHIAEDLADLTGASGAKPAKDLGATHTLISADGSGIGQILHLDREQLIAQNMLNKGNDRAAAERDVDGLISLVESVKDAKVRLTQNDRLLRLEIGIGSESEKSK
jgi:hypothetical protein